MRISADAERFAGECGSTEVERCVGMAVGNNRLYVPTESHEGTAEFGDTNEVVAFDLTTGKMIGARADAGERYTMIPLRMDGGDVIAYKVPPYDKGGQVVSLDGTTLEETVLMENPSTEKTRDAETYFGYDRGVPVREGTALPVAEHHQRVERRGGRGEAPRDGVHHRLTPVEDTARSGATAPPVTP